MKKKYLFAIMPLIFCLSLIGIRNKNNVKENEKTNENANALKEVQESSSSIITMKDIEQFLLTKATHYPLSDEFIEKYQQTSGGYLDYAKELGKIVDKEKHEPDQKWHFFDSWLYRSIDDGSLTWDESAENRVYTKLLCPELLLWIYEACEVNPNKVRSAMKVAEQGKSSKTATSSIAANMRKIVSWDDLKVAIENYKNSNANQSGE